jgi:hypothetical protein
MACRCNERRIALATAAAAVRRGETVAVAKDLRFVARTMIEDAAFAARAQLALSRATLGRGMRR